MITRINVVTGEVQLLNETAPSFGVVEGIPAEVSRFQAKAALADAGLLSQADAIVAASGNPILQLAWTDATEFTAYTATARLPWTIVAPTTTPTVDNGAAIAAATLTFAAGGPYNLYGAAVLQAAAKGATTGKILMALRFTNPRLNMGAGDDLAFHYGLTLSDAG